MPPQPSAHSDVIVDAPPDAVYALITDLPTLAELADEATAMEWRKGHTAVAKGAVFVGHNRNGGKQWSTTCTVTDAEPGRTFAFDVKSLVIPVAHWRYDLEPTADGGCRVVESTWDRRPGWFRKVASMATGVSDRDGTNAANIQATLQRLKQRAEQPRA